MASPTPSLDSLRGNSIGSFGDQADYLSLSPLADSPLTVSGSSPPVSDLSDIRNIDQHFNTDQHFVDNIEQHFVDNIDQHLCVECREQAVDSKFLPCYHSFCQVCLEKNKFECSRCVVAEVTVPNSVETLLSNLFIDNNSQKNLSIRCEGCKSNSKKEAVARCVDCSNYLCANCVMAHQFMHCFEDHRVLDLSKEQQTSNNVDSNKPQDNKTLLCPRHKSETLKYYCRTCGVPICKECTVLEHSAGLHEVDHLADVGAKQLETLSVAVHEVKSKATDIRNMLKTVEHNSGRLQVQFHKAQNEINDTFLFYRSMLEERKQELLKELESVFSAKQLSLGVVSQKGTEMIENIYKTTEIVERFNKCASVVEMLMLRKLVDAKLQSFLAYTVDQSVAQTCELEFVSNYQAIQVGVRNTFGYVRSSNESIVGPSKQPPIARPSNSIHSNGISSSSMHSSGNLSGMSGGSVGSGGISVGSGGHSGGHSGISRGGDSGISHSGGISSSISSGISSGGISLSNGGSSISSSLSSSGHVSASGMISGSSSSGSSINGSSGSLNGVTPPFINGGSLHSQSNSPFDTTSIISKRFSSANSLGPFSATIGDLNLNGINPYEKWSNGSDNIFQNEGYSSSHASSGDNMLDLTSKLMSVAMFPPKSQIKRSKMIYNCKFGEFGILEAQFTEPSGVAVNQQNDIVVADTNNHRIQIFDKEGRFKFQFGECGKRDGQLLYPNRVAVVRTTGDIIVTERSPTHQVQLFNQYGQFVRKFGANILQHPRGVTVDHKGRIVVVECKVMRVIIFDQTGTVLQKFGCSKHLEFPNGVVVNDKQEIFISDNRAHCVKVFSYEGTYLRQIGGEGITNYPIGVGINAAGEILIADNHNNFNLTIFTQDGNLVSALESKVKHAQCFDVALMDDGSVVLASKDYRLYIYRYVQVPPIGM